MQMEEKRAKHREYVRQWNAKHPEYYKTPAALEAARIRHKRHRMNHPEPGRIRANQWRLAHPKEHSEKLKAWREKNPEQVMLYSRAYEVAHRDKRTQYRQLHRERRILHERQYRKDHPERVKIILRNYKMRHPGLESQRQARRKTYLSPITGYFNEWFSGSHLHHMGNGYGIYLPKVLHNAIRHSLVNDKNMEAINWDALTWLVSQNEELRP
jgi:hypothetical protein